MIGRLLDLTPRARARAPPSCSTGSTSTEAADRPAKTYSGGMRRRLDLAASLVGRPAVVFLDEPTTGLDPAKRDDMWDVVRALVERRLHRPAHHPVPRGGRRAGRRHRGLRPRPRHRRTTRPTGSSAIVGDQRSRCAPPTPSRWRRRRRSSARRPARTPRSRRAAPSPPPLTR